MAITARGLGLELAGQPVFSGVDLDVTEGELVVVTGEYGSGKSVLLRCLVGLEPHTGELAVRGPTRLVGAEPALDAARTVLDHGDPADPAWTLLLERLGLTEHRAKTPVMLSRGTATKVQLAQAFWARPQNYLFDEPFNGLDRLGRELLVTLVSEALSVGGCAVVATHDVDALAGLTHTLLVLPG